MKYLIAALMMAFILAPKNIVASNNSQTTLDYIQDRTVLVLKQCKDSSKSSMGLRC